MYEKATALLIITLIVLLLTYERPTESIKQSIQTGVAQRIESKVLKPKGHWERWWITFYCPCYKCSEGWGTKTASGKPVEHMKTGAATEPFGTMVYVPEENKTIEVNDRGGGVNDNHLDIFVNDCSKHQKSYYTRVFIKEK